MALFDPPKLKGIEDLNDPRYSMRAIINKENAPLGGKAAYNQQTGIWAMDEDAKKAAESKGGTNAIESRKKDSDKWEESLKPMQIAGGKAQGPIQGRKNVESGHWAKLSKLGGEATAKLKKEIKEQRYSEILPEIPEGWITRKDTCAWFMQSSFCKEWKLISAQFMSILLADVNYFETKGNGRNKMYRKKD